MRMNFSHCEQSKKPSKPWEEKRKKKRGKGSKRGVRRRAIKTDRATNDRGKKKKDQEQRGSVVPTLHSQGPAASRVVAARKEPEHRAGSAGGAPAPLPALIPLTTSTLRFVLNVHFYWCSPFAKMCLITQM